MTANRLVPALFFVCATSLPLHAATVIYSINANGAKEVSAGGIPNQGDPDGSAIGTLTFDNGTGAGSTGSVTFNITLSNIDLTSLFGHHIHNAPTTTTGGIVLDFGDPDTIRSGSVLSGTITGLNAVTITDIQATPTNFYYNIHNTAFPGGAVRDQLGVVPEPSASVLFAAAGLGLLRRRRA